jgi:hypothetical protein
VNRIVAAAKTRAASAAARNGRGLSDDSGDEIVVVGEDLVS